MLWSELATTSLELGGAPTRLLQWKWPTAFTSAQRAWLAGRQGRAEQGGTRCVSKQAMVRWWCSMVAKA
jgi:hypothetical protein